MCAVTGIIGAVDAITGTHRSESYVSIKDSWIAARDNLVDIRRLMGGEQDQVSIEMLTRGPVR